MRSAVGAFGSQKSPLIGIEGTNLQLAVGSRLDYTHVGSVERGERNLTLEKYSENCGFAASHNFRTIPRHQLDSVYGIGAPSKYVLLPGETELPPMGIGDLSREVHR